MFYNFIVLNAILSHLNKETELFGVYGFAHMRVVLSSNDARLVANTLAIHPFPCPGLSISYERYQVKHDSFMSEIKELQKRHGDIGQKYETKYMNVIANIKLSQQAKRLFRDQAVNIDDKRIILTKLFEKISVKNNSTSVTYTKLTQATTRNSGLSREILRYAK